jgi:predicted small lipoprotein YifL
MKKLSFALVGAAALALAACGGKGDDAPVTTSRTI